MITLTKSQEMKKNKGVGREMDTGEVGHGKNRHEYVQGTGDTIAYVAAGGNMLATAVIHT